MSIPVISSAFQSPKHLNTRNPTTLHPKRTNNKMRHKKKYPQLGSCIHSNCCMLDYNQKVENDISYLNYDFSISHFQNNVFIISLQSQRNEIRKGSK